MWDDCEGIGRLRDGREVLRTKEGTRHAQERKMIVRRVKAGLAARKAKGLRLGRVPLPMKTLNHARRLRQTGLSYAEIVARCSGVMPTNFSRMGNHCS